MLGVPVEGQLPVISGDAAVTRSELSFPGDERAIIKIGNSNVPDNGTPSHITVECLDLQSARLGYTFTDDSGSASEFADNASTIYVETGDNITIRNCIMHDAGNGKDRSAGTVIRYNWIENGNRQLDLVETGHDEIATLPEYRETFVYGNVLVEGDGQGNSQILHYGGDGDGEYRGGTLFFYHNTVVSTRSGNTTLARLSSSGESIDARNNVFFVTGAGTSFGLLDEAGDAELDGNFMPEGFRTSHGTPTGSITEGTNVEGADPGFADLSSQDFRLIADADAAGIAVPLHTSAAAHPITLEYALHQAAVARPSALDAGAFEAR